MFPWQTVGVLDSNAVVKAGNDLSETSLNEPPVFNPVAEVFASCTSGF